MGRVTTGSWETQSSGLEASVSPSPQSSVLSASEITPLSLQEWGKVEHFLSGQRGVKGRAVASLRMAKTRQGHRGTGVGSPRQF